MQPIQQWGAIAALTLCALQTAHANVAAGELWRVPESVAGNAVPANVPGTTPDVTFKVNTPFNFSTGGPITLGSWLATSSAFDIVENTPGTLNALTDDGVQGALLNFTGTVSVTNGQSFTVTHDDGLTLIIGGINLNFSPGPTGPVQSVAVYNGPTGNQPFQLVYTECCGGAAVLQVDLPLSAVPEPQSWALLWAGLGLALPAALRRRPR